MADLRSASSWSFSAMATSGSEALAQLLDGALLGGEGLLLALDARLLVVLALADLREDAGLLALLLETLHGVLEGFAILDSHSGHSIPRSSGLLGAAKGKRQGAGRGAPGSRWVDRRARLTDKGPPCQGFFPPAAPGVAAA